MRELRNTFLHDYPDPEPLRALALTRTDLLDRHLAVRRALYRRLGERKADLLVHPRTREPSPMEVIARKTGVPLQTIPSSRQPQNPCPPSPQPP